MAKNLSESKKKIHCPDLMPSIVPLAIALSVAKLHMALTGEKKLKPIYQGRYIEYCIYIIEKI